MGLVTQRDEASRMRKSMASGHGGFAGRTCHCALTPCFSALGDSGWWHADEWGRQPWTPQLCPPPNCHAHPALASFSQLLQRSGRIRARRRAWIITHRELPGSSWLSETVFSHFKELLVCGREGRIYRVMGTVWKDV